MWGKLITLMQKYQMWRAGWLRKTLEKDGLIFHYAQKGKASTSPTLLILHGFAESMETWAEVVGHFPRDAHIIGLDLPGHGKAPLAFPSDCVDCGSLRFASFVRAFILAKGLDRVPAGLHVLGHSMGGYIAGSLAALHGEELHVSLLTLVAPAMVTPTPSPFWSDVLEGKFEEWLIPDSIEGAAGMMRNVTGITEEETQGLVNRCLIKGLHELNQPRLEVRRRVWSGLEPELERWSETEARWSQIKAKTHLLWGSADVIVDSSGASHLSSIIKEAKVEVMEGQPHGLNLVAAAQVAASTVLFRGKTTTQKDEEQIHL